MNLRCHEFILHRLRREVGIMVLVRQRCLNDCVVASLAMVAGLPYEASDHFLAEVGGRSRGCGHPDWQIFRVLGDLGLQWASLLPEDCQWPPMPFMDRHLLMVYTGLGSHAVACDSMGVIYDPAIEDWIGESDYPRWWKGSRDQWPCMQDMSSGLLRVIGVAR